MGAIDYLADQGFTIQAVGGRLMVAPSSKLTPDLREWIKRHRAELVEQSQRHRCWRVYRAGKPIGTMVGAECTKAEALEHARFHWRDADIKPNEVRDHEQEPAV